MRFGTILSRLHITEVKAMMNDTLSITTKCPHCGRLKTFQVSGYGIRKWQGGELIQNALPLLSKEDRELLQTGTCEACWDRLYKNL